MQSASLFTNWTEEDFTWTWDNVPYTFKAGSSMYLEDWKAQHFAGHLVDRELTKQHKPVDDQTREDLIKKCLGATPIQAEDSSKLTSTILNANNSVQSNQELVESPVQVPVIPDSPKRMCQLCDTKGYRHMKNCPTLTATSVTMAAA